MGGLTGILLGQMQIALNERPISFSYDKVRALLIYLWVESDCNHHRDTLAALLWPEADDTHARTNLRKALAVLRLSIGDHEAAMPQITVTRDTLQFNRCCLNRLDVAQFRLLANPGGLDSHTPGVPNSATANQLEAAMRLYQGDFLGHVGPRESAPFTEWAAATREQLHQCAVATLGRLARYYERRSEWDPAQRVLRQILTLEPWDEEAYRALMSVLARRGQRGAALQQYERCRRMLDSELGMRPEAATDTLRDQIRAGALLEQTASR